MTHIGFLGPKGTFSDLACQRIVDGRSEFIPVATRTIDDLFDKLADHTFQSIVVPAENSIEGPVNQSIDRLIQLPDSYLITAEITLPIRHVILSKTKTSLSEITDIYSHYQPLAQCQRFLRTKCPQADTHVVTSSAKAAEMVAYDQCGFSDPENHTPAVVGHKGLSEMYGLQLVIPDCINDSEGNSTRFYVISNAVTEETGQDFTSIVVGTKKDQPGSLYAILGEFASRSINLTRILSRPTKKELGEYLFYIECEGHCLNAGVSDALRGVQAKSGFYRHLGSYPKGKEND